MDNRKRARELTKRIIKRLDVRFRPGQHVMTPDRILEGIIEEFLDEDQSQQDQSAISVPPEGS